MEDGLTLEQLISAVLDGGATLGMLLLFGFVILKLPSLMQEAISKAIAPAVESTRNLGQQITRMQQELERLSTLILLQQQQSAKRGNNTGSAINTELQEHLYELHRRNREQPPDSEGVPPKPQEPSQAAKDAQEAA